VVTHHSDPQPASEEGAYRPRLRTALVLTGTGTAGAYHAGVLRALQEAGVKIDLIAAHGVGAGNALLAAIDGAARLWEPKRVWRSRRVRRFYRWRPAVRASFLTVAAGALVIGLPLLVLATGLLIFPVGFAVGLFSPALGLRLQSTYVALVGRAFQPEMLPTILPRLALLTVAMVVAIVGATAFREFVARGDRRREHGPWWARVLGAPWSARDPAALFRDALWQFLRGASQLKQPPARDLARRYAEVLGDNLGQPGFRELIIATHDVDARQDLVFALLAEPLRRDFVRRGPFGMRRRPGDVMDLAGLGRDHVLDALAGCLSLPVLTDGHPIAFAIDSYWRGETHRLTDRSGAIMRLLDEVAAAGVRQVLVVSSAAERGLPHGLVARSLRFRARVGEYLAASEVASTRDALISRRSLFESMFHIVPVHNPIGSLDFAGCRDDRSDRTYPLTELIDRGYEDAYRQFIEPIVGASGEKLTVRNP